MEKRMYRPIVISLPVHSPDIWSNLKAADVSPKNNSEYSVVNPSTDFSSQSTANASQDNSKGDRNGGHSGSGGSNPSSYFSCAEDLDNQRLGIKLSLPSQVTSKSFSDSPYLANTSSTFSSGPSYKGLVTTVGNASPSIAHSAISGTVQDVGLSVWPSKMAVAPTSKKCLWQSEVHVGSSCSLPSLDTVRQISGCQSVRQLQSGTSMQVACKPLSAVPLWASDDRVRLRPKKRKGAALDLLPWHIEVARGPCKLQTVSCLAESEWVLASNRLSEKTDEINHGVVSASQATKRLRLTTQLLQQLIRPAPEAILSSDARLNGESAVFYVCRLALGDACSLTRDSHLDHLASDKPFKKFGTSDNIGKQDFLKTLENFNQRGKRLESDLLRLEKLSTIAETKVEIQELEKFSLTSRFAKLHLRGNVVLGDASSSDSGATRKPCPQRYVVAHPMPKILPEKTICLSL